MKTSNGLQDSLIAKHIALPFTTNIRYGTDGKVATESVDTYLQ